MPRQHGQIFARPTGPEGQGVQSRLVRIRADGSRIPQVRAQAKEEKTKP